MDTDIPEDTVAQVPRRSTRRHSPGTTLIFEVTPRGPLKRSKRGKNVLPSSIPIINGSKNLECGSEDEEFPSKKNRLEDAETYGGSGDKKEMDVQESSQEITEDQEMDNEELPVDNPFQTNVAFGSTEHVTLSPYVELGERCYLTENPDRHFLKPAGLVSTTKESSAFTKPSTHSRSSDNARIHKGFSKDGHKTPMEAKAERSGILNLNHHSDHRLWAPTVMEHPVRQRATQLLAGNVSIPHKRKEVKKTAAVTSRTSAGSSRGFLSYFCGLLLMFPLLLGMSKLIALYRGSPQGAAAPVRAAQLQSFAGNLSQLESRFLNQRPDLWKRSRIHLEKHLKTPRPTEPVSLILTAGLGAEKTLACLAEGLAAAFSSALGSSALRVDGAAEAGRGSDEVKLDIDRQLRVGFGEGRVAAVIHRLEELPPGSTLIFYRYCDHEHAAYKEVFLAFTVLLPRNEVGGQLGAIEEMVQDYLKDRMAGPGGNTAFNEMDADKFGGLWSRISHLVLPVVAEEDVEQKGCKL
ncbi:torsin-1A-interacting protein 2-like isoform X2 [Stigmatopora nigra]